MIKQYFTQAWAQLRQQPMISAVSIAGTALAIFLIMLVVMLSLIHIFVSLVIFLILLVVVLVGIYIPARNISRIPPTEALRDE